MKTDEVCGRPRHPFGCTLPLLGLYCCFGGRKVHKLIRATIKNQLCKRAPKVSKGRSESPLVASAEAKPLRYEKRTISFSTNQLRSLRLAIRISRSSDSKLVTAAATYVSAAALSTFRTFRSSSAPEMYPPSDSI